MGQIDWKQAGPVERGIARKNSETYEYADEIFWRIYSLAIRRRFDAQKGSRRGVYQVSFTDLTQDEEQRQAILARLKGSGSEFGLGFVSLDTVNQKCTFRLVKASRLPWPPDES